MTKRNSMMVFIIGAILALGATVYAGGSKRTQNDQQQSRGGAASDMGYGTSGSGNTDAGGTDMGYGSGSDMGGGSMGY